MKTFKLLTLITLCSIVHLNKIYAQKDYIITNKGDTLKGQFTGKKFKANGWDKGKRLDLDSIKEIYKDEENVLKRAVYDSTNSERTFMVVLENGKVSLYENMAWKFDPTKPPTTAPFVNSNMTLVRYLYVTKGTDTLKKLEYNELLTIQLKSKKKRMDVLAQLIADNKEVYDKFILDDKFGLKQIRNIIHLYNTGKPFVEIIKPPKKEDASDDFNPSQN